MKCRFCHSHLQTEFVDLGMQPPSNNYLKPEQNLSRESFYPLITYVCDKCKLVQTLDFTSSEELFTDEYAYFSSYSSSWLAHAKDYVQMISKRLNLDSNSKIIELASNDGYLLQYFKEKNIFALGIEPCKSVANAALAKDIETRIEFFNTTTAKNLPQADLILGNNVLAHVPDINDFIAGVASVLKKDGTVNFEFPHLLNLINYNQFDTIYHEHYSYLSLIFVSQLFEKHGLQIYDVEELTTHGGSLRIYGCHKDNFIKSENVDRILLNEDKLHNLDTYRNYNTQVKQTKRKLLELLIELKNQGKSIVAYGAAAKGNTLFNYCGIGKDFIDYATDLNPSKQNKFLPGVHIAIKDPAEIAKTKPDYILITPWNIKAEIIKQLDYTKAWGAKFIVAIPQAKIL